MIRLTLQDLLDCIEAVLLGKEEFPALREFVFRFYESEVDLELDEHLEAIHAILLPYLQDEEALGDPDREKRLRRVLLLLRADLNSIKERVVFGLDFDKACGLTRKAAAGVISPRVYREQLGKLSPAEYDLQLIEDWAKRHVGVEEPMPGRLK